MEMEGSEKIDLEFEAHGLIDNIEFSGVMSAEKEVDTCLNNDHLPQLHESTEPQLNQRNGRYNLRVLDPEELSSMITGADKGEKHLLPGIQEDVSGSTESISTFQSDNLTFETLEDDLFVDIRASIQRSSKRTSNLMKSSSTAAALEVDSAAISSLKKEDFASQNKAQKNSGLQTVRMSKCQPKQNSGKMGSGKAIKQDSGHSQITSTAKTVSTAVINLTGIASSKGSQPPKVSLLGGARRVLPKPAVSSKFSLLAASTTSREQPTWSSASSDSASSMSSGTPAKSSTLTPRRNTGKSGSVGTGPSGSIPKTPSRALLKNKPAPSKLSAYVMSSKTSSSVSPASSISEWSSASSSSSMFNQRCNNSRTSLDTSTCRSVDGDIILLDPSNEPADQTADVHGNQEVSLTSNMSKKSSTQTSTGYKFCYTSKIICLQAKSSARTPNGHQQSQAGLHAVFPKNGAATCTPIRSSNSKLKSAKAANARTSTSFGSTKDSSPKATSPTSFQEKSNALVNTTSAKMDVKDSFSATGESFQKAEEIEAEDGVKQVVGEGMGATIKDNVVVDLNMHKSMGTGDIKTAYVEEIVDSGSHHTERIEDLLINQNHLKKNSDPICEDTDKENRHVKYPGEEMTGDNKDAYQIVHESIDQILSNTTESALPFPATASESAACRAPLALKNVFCSNEGIDMPKELATQVAVADKTGFVLPSSEQKENS
ncbi:UNVERIFIED_CONTAM: hypothetical protein Sangu_1490100 [Sesamum angustifolium]|uniref:Uncharacterized protein n=1 Tax=Sesamum angustifolium TaxID=2727405 RepID=A0AAW2MRH6_9LAMI